MVIIITIISQRFIYVTSFNLHNSRKALSSPLQINMSWNIVVSLWNIGCCQCCIYKCNDSTIYPFLTSPPPSENKLPLKHLYSINVNMILSVNPKHKALEFFSLCLSAEYTASPLLQYLLHSSHLFIPTPALSIQVLIIWKLDAVHLITFLVLKTYQFHRDRALFASMKF